MTNSILSTLLFSLGLAFFSQAQSPTISQQVKDNVKSRVDNGLNPGIVVGIVTSKGTEYFSYGVKSLETKEQVDENSIFEIGSISKTFTGVMLADMIIKKEVSFEEPLQNLLPKGVNSPTIDGQSIQLVHLSNHTSALPRLPNNLTPSKPSNPYANYSEKDLYDFLSNYKLTRAIGSQFEYSNYAVGLLGNIMAAKNKMSYEELMVDIIAKPLGMENTRIVFTPNMKKNLAYGHSYGVQVDNWDLSVLAGAGGIRSSAADMVKFLLANMGSSENALYPALQLSHQVTTASNIAQKVGLGWIIDEKNNQKYIWHNGATGGYRSFTGFIKGEDFGVIVLTNADAPITDLGMFLMDSTKVLSTPKIPIGIKLKEMISKNGLKKAINSYWELVENDDDTYNFDEEQLNQLGYLYIAENEIEEAIAVLDLNTQVYPASSNAYDSYAEALLLKNKKKKAIVNYKKSVALNPGNINGIKMLKKLGVETEDLVKEVEIDGGILASYVGNYELAPGFILTISKDGNQLYAKATGQGENPIYPKSDTEFFFKVVDAQIVFNRNEAGQVESLTLFQAGQEINGKKIKK